jgi:hypothetical protein
MFRTGADALTLEEAAAIVPGPFRSPPAAYARRAAVALMAVAALGWTGLTTGVDVAAAAVGAGVAHPRSGETAVAYVGVRLNARELASNSVQSDLQLMHLTAVVDRTTALTEPQAMRTMAWLGVNVASGGRGSWQTGGGHDSDPALWTRAWGDVRASKALGQLTGVPVTVFVPGRRVNAWDLIACGDTHSSLVVPDHTVDAHRAAVGVSPLHLTGRDIYLINGLDATPAQLSAVLARLGAGLVQAHLVAVPLGDLA